MKSKKAHAFYVTPLGKYFTWTILISLVKYASYCAFYVIADLPFWKINYGMIERCLT